LNETAAYALNGIAGLNTCGDEPKNLSFTLELKMKARACPEYIRLRNRSPTKAVTVIFAPSNDWPLDN
jgi:hypothetical protein